MATLSDQTSLDPALALHETGPDSVAGAFLRRFWQPIALASRLTADDPVLPIRVLAEDLVLFRATDGELGLVQARCPHNGYPLADGSVAARSLVCAKHSWHFGRDGACWVLGYQDKIYPVQWANAQAYPVEIYAGLCWAYLGGESTPPLPSFEIGASLHVTAEPIAAVSWVARVTSRLQEGAHLLLPTHTRGAGLHLTLPVDDDHSWSVTIAPTSAPEPTATMHPGAAGPDGAEIIRAWEAYARQGEPS